MNFVLVAAPAGHYTGNVRKCMECVVKKWESVGNCGKVWQKYGKVFGKCGKENETCKDVWASVVKMLENVRKCEENVRNVWESVGKMLENVRTCGKV